MTMLFSARGVTVTLVTPLLDGEPSAAVDLRLTEGDPLAIDLTAPAGTAPHAIGVRLHVSGGRAYLRNGYQSWDGSYFVAPGTPAGDGPPGRAPTLGFAMTALLPYRNDGAVVLGVDRHDRFQTRFRFGGDADTLLVDVETLTDATGETQSETLFLFDGEAVEECLRRWSTRVAAAAPTPPRLPKRITGWCSWYSLYASLDEGLIRDHLYAARAYRDAHGVPLDIFQIDDGFTPEMGDWLDMKPQFPTGVAPLLAEAAADGFTPGLWIAPFLVGNRSKLFAQHPDWVVQDRQTGGPLVAFTFYGEFRWHKRSEEYYVLDVTHPGAAAWLQRVLRVWTQEWGARYIKADFLYHGAEYGPERARWHWPGLSRMQVWRHGMQLIRDAIGPDTTLSGCGCPLWASVGLVDAVRIGRDVGVEWHGDYSAESLLRDLQTRNHGHGILWQADPDCILLRDRFHHMTAGEVDLLARFAAGAGGVAMTSDHLGELTPDRAALFADLLREGVDACDFPRLGKDGLIVQRRRRGDTVLRIDLINPTGQEQDGVPPHGWTAR